MIVIQKSNNENSGKKSTKDLRSIPFSQRNYTDFITVSYEIDSVDISFSCGYIPEFDLKRFLLSSQFDRLRYKELWTNEHEQLARIFLTILKGIPVESSDFSHLHKYIELYLSAYLKKACWIAAKEFYRKRGAFLQRNYDISDYHVIAWEKIQDKKKVFNKFRLESNCRVESYAIEKLLSQIRDEIFKENPHLKKSKYKEYGLLRNISQKTELQPALKSFGLDSQAIEQTILIWRCFKEIYRPNNCKGGQKLPPPTLQDCANIAQLYNRKCDRLIHSQQTITSEEIIPRLEKCVEAIEAWSKVSIVYPDRNFSSGEFSGEWDKIEQEYFSRNISPLSDNIVESIQSTLVQSFAILSPYHQGILTVLDFGLKATQKDLGYYLGVDQSTIKRHRDKSLISLFKEFIQRWNTSNPQLKLNNPNNELIAYLTKKNKAIDQNIFLKRLKDELLDGQLTDLCFFRIYSFFDNHLKCLGESEKRVLKSFYRTGNNIKGSYENETYSSAALSNQQDYNKLEISFKNKVLEYLGNDFGISPHCLNPLMPKIDPFFQNWIYSFTNLD